MNFIEIIKTGADIMTTVGVGALSKNAIDLVKPEKSKFLNKICITFGAMVLADMVSSAAVNFVEKEIDDTVEKVKSVFHLNKKEENAESTKKEGEEINAETAGYPESES